ncbi:hypothetical protein GOP47_0012541 [Adiantum capillus-veneris]|uniref:Protein DETOXIFICATION n=1 Tax=Adiantum capillus-veneris TaxID=13818 RepID=A0A9D4UQW3_ADICA|nr:hypothetical protein GOP47_0012541 [Adiantum capillus-veneris]
MPYLPGTCWKWGTWVKVCMSAGLSSSLHVLGPYKRMECLTGGITLSSTILSSENKDQPVALNTNASCKVQKPVTDLQLENCLVGEGNLSHVNKDLANRKMQHIPPARRTSSPSFVPSPPAKPSPARRASAPVSMSSISTRPSAALRASSPPPSESQAQGYPSTARQSASPPSDSLAPSATARTLSSSSIDFSPALGSLQATEEDTTTKDGVGGCPEEFVDKEEEEKVELLQERKLSPRDIRDGDNDNDGAAAAAWYVMDQVKKRPTLKQTWKEVHRQTYLGFPMAATNMMWFARYIVSTAFLGQLGGLELAAGTLALTFANVAGWSILIGLAGGMEAVCSQAHGAGRRKVLELTLRRGFIVLLLAALPIAGAWYKAEGLLLLMGQTPVLAKAAQTYLRYLLPDLLATCFIAPLRFFLRSQCITRPVLLCSLLALCLHVPLNYLLISTFGIGAPGTALAICITDFVLAIMLLGYVLLIFPLKRSDDVMSCTDENSAAAPTWGSLLSLAVPCCLMTCMEGWCYEIMVLLTGLLPQPKEAVETVAIVLNGDTILYALEVALASCVCTRVGNELGAKRPVRAYHAAMVALWVSMALGFVGAGWLLLSSRMAWGRFFTKDVKVLKSVAQLLPIMAIIELANFPQNVACGVLRGSARPTMGALINLGTFYVIGIPLAILLGFKYGMGLLGLWIGLATAAATTAILTVTVVLHTDWRIQTSRAYKLSNPRRALLQEAKGTPDEQTHKKGKAEPFIIMPREETFLSNGCSMKGDNGDPKVDASCTKLSNLTSFEQPLARLKELEVEEPDSMRMDSINKRIRSVEDQFADGNWKLLKTGSGRQALGKSYGSSKSGHIQDGHCWEVSMSMMNESVRKCAMMARLEAEERGPHSKRLNGCTQASSRDMKRAVFNKLRLFSSKKGQHKKGQVSERRKTA